MTIDSWVLSVPDVLKQDAVWRLEVYRLALFLTDLAWSDVSKLAADRRTRSLADQLYRSAGAVSADIEEGYSRSGGKDRARFYEYALGSAREARGWYYKGRHVLGETVTAHRMELGSKIIRLILTILPEQRQLKIRPHDHDNEYDL
jgi:four helix bundle protein